MFASSLGFRIVVNLISRGGREEKTLKNFLSFFPPAGFLPSSIPTAALISYSVDLHCKMYVKL